MRSKVAQRMLDNTLPEVKEKVDKLVKERIMEREQVENNKLIAEFMGYKPSKNVIHSSGETTLINKDKHGFTTFCTVEMMRYHEDWNALMPVVEKIEDIDKLGGIVNIVQGQCKITAKWLGDNTVYADKSNYMTMGVRGKLKSTYEAVVEFIKWYNGQTNKETGEPGMEVD